MTDDKDIAALLKESIHAQNRATHAIRAIARFILVQFVAVTIAAPLAFVGISLALLPFSLAAIAVLVTGIVWSSIAAWSELGLSDPLREERRAAQDAALRSADMSRLERALSADERASRRRGQRKELWSSKRFRIAVVAAAVVSIGAAGAVAVVAIQVENDRVTRSEMLESNLDQTFDEAVTFCASSLNIAESDLIGRTERIDSTLRVVMANPDRDSDRLVSCVAAELTGSGDMEDIAPGQNREIGLFIVERSEQGRNYSFTPTSLAS